MTSSSRFVLPFAVPPLIAILSVATPAAADPEYPREMIARPLTFPQGLLSVGADAGGNHDLSAMTGAPIAGYGITDKLEVQIPYAFATHDFEARGTVGADVGYAVVRGAVDGKLEMIARVRGGYDTLSLDATPLMAGIHVQYNVTPWLALISGAPGTQQFHVALAENADGMKPIELALPFGLGLQAASTLYFQLDTRLAQLNIHESENALLVRDATPVSMTVVWNALPQLDIQGAIATDVKDAADALSFLVGLRVYTGIVK
jgi:hypothetical protein